MLWCDQRNGLLRTEERAVVPPEECAVANSGADPAACCQSTQESAVLRTDNVAAPNRNLAVLIETRHVFDENWGVLDENSAPAGLAAWLAFPPNTIPK